MIERFERLRADAAWYRRHAVWCAHLSTQRDEDAALCGILAAQAWLAAEKARSLEATASHREKAAWCQP